MDNSGVETAPASMPSAREAAPAAVFAPDPARGRVFTTAPRLVRSTDATPAGRLRFDALARYLQEAAEDDVAAAGWQDECHWLLRRCALAVQGYPRRGDEVRLRTFCSATGPRWAERTSTVSGPGGDLIQSRAVWVAVDPATGRPRPLGPRFTHVYGESAAGRAVSARLSHPAPDGGSAGRDWALRASDFDLAGHVNNSIHWAAVEDVLAGLDWLPSSAGIEYHRPILPGQPARLATRHEDGGLWAWLTGGGKQFASAVLAR
jgi:acyl-ACP thioesterase